MSAVGCGRRCRQRWALASAACSVNGCSRQQQGQAGPRPASSLCLLRLACLLRVAHPPARPPAPPPQVNEYPGQRTFKAIGTGDQAFVAAMTACVEEVVGKVHEECISSRLSTKGNYISVTGGWVGGRVGRCCSVLRGHMLCMRWCMLCLRWWSGCLSHVEAALGSSQATRPQPPHRLMSSLPASLPASLPRSRACVGGEP